MFTKITRQINFDKIISMVNAANELSKADKEAMARKILATLGDDLIKEFNNTDVKEI